MFGLKNLFTLGKAESKTQDPQPIPNFSRPLAQRPLSRTSEDDRLARQVLEDQELILAMEYDPDSLTAMPKHFANGRFDEVGPRRNVWAEELADGLVDGDAEMGNVIFDTDKCDDEILFSVGNDEEADLADSKSKSFSKSWSLPYPTSPGVPGAPRKVVKYRPPLAIRTDLPYSCSPTYEVPGKSWWTGSPESPFGNMPPIPARAAVESPNHIIPSPDSFAFFSHPPSLPSPSLKFTPNRFVGLLTGETERFPAYTEPFMAVYKRSKPLTRPSPYPVVFPEWLINKEDPFLLARTTKSKTNQIKSDKQKQSDGSELKIHDSGSSSATSKTSFETVDLNEGESFELQKLTKLGKSYATARQQKSDKFWINWVRNADCAPSTSDKGKGREVDAAAPVTPERRTRPPKSFATPEEIETARKIWSEKSGQLWEEQLLRGGRLDAAALETGSSLAERPVQASNATQVGEDAELLTLKREEQIKFSWI